MTYFVQDADRYDNAMDPYDIYSWDEGTAAYVLNGEPKPASDAGTRSTASAVCDECGDARVFLWRDCACGSNGIEGFLVSSEDKDLVFDTNKSLNRTWFHATNRANWMESVKSAGLGIHLGSRETAVDHGNRQYGESEYFLYELYIASQASICPFVCPDLSDRWSSQERLPAPLVAYVNAYETAGRVSLYGSPERVSVASVQVLRAGTSAA